MPPILCINADFEMAWSGRRVPDDPARDGQFGETPETVGKILEILDRYEIPVTWATVGALLLTKPFDFGRFAEFNNADPFFTGSWYDVPPFGSPRGRFFYAPQSVERILSAKVRHEIGCHTFTHLYFGAGSVSRKRFAMELDACAEAAAEWGIRLESFVYPSQFIAEAGLLAEKGYKVYRQDALEWFRFGKPYIPSFNVTAKNRLRKLAGGVCKWIDERFCFTPASYGVTRESSGMTTFVCSTIFPGFYGISKYVTSEQRVKRICKGIGRAVREDGLFSFFFHPWQMNRRREECLGAFEQICAYAAKMRETEGLRILTIRELCGLC